MSIRSLLIFAGSLLLVGGVHADESLSLKTDKEKLSYSIGASIGKNLTRDATEVDLAVLIEGLKATLGGQTLVLTDKEIRQRMYDYEKDLRKQATLRRQKAQAENRQKGEAYLADFRKQPGVLASPGGVLYQVIQEGSGRKPLETDTVEVNYRGRLIDGTEFDATEPTRPAGLKVATLITGWKQALTMMPVGSKWHLVIPAQLGYGERGVGSDIGPDEVLVFDVELVGIK